MLKLLSHLEESFKVLKMVKKDNCYLNVLVNYQKKIFPEFFLANFLPQYK